MKAMRHCGEYFKEMRSCIYRAHYCDIEFPSKDLYEYTNKSWLTKTRRENDFQGILMVIDWVGQTIGHTTKSLSTSLKEYADMGEYRCPILHIGERWVEEIDGLWDIDDGGSGIVYALHQGGMCSFDTRARDTLITILNQMIEIVNDYIRFFDRSD
jgi:hypothetical protein